LEAPKVDRKFINARARLWKNKTTGKKFKVLPWFQPMEDRSEFDYKGMVKDCFPELEKDFLCEWDCYRGTVLHLGWMLENENGCWFGLMPISIRDQFEEIGYWSEEETTCDSKEA
jgi:hypothetical protein